MSLAGRERLTAELRSLNRLSVGALLDDDVAHRAADVLARLAEDLSFPVESTPWWWCDTAAVRTGGWERFNPVAPPVQLSFDGTAVKGTVQMGVEFTGPPGCVHGGFVATLLDHALGIYLSHIERPSLTASLTVGYLAPTPLGEQLELEASHSIMDGTRTEAWAELRHEGRTTARAEGRFRLITSAPLRKTRSAG